MALQLVLFPVLQILDFLTTIVGVALGLAESNPVVIWIWSNFGYIGFFMAKLAAAVIVPTLLLSRVSPSYAFRTLLAFNVLMTLVVIGNLVKIAIVAK